MSQSNRTFRIFVSSTFSDLKEERNALQKYVFPRLRDLAMAHGCRFQDIDLRWGVSEEASLDHQTMKICLAEIERSQNISPRPNFIFILGDRFGWRPLPFSIPVDEFEQLLPQLTAEEQEKLVAKDDQPEGEMGWYRRDNNAVPPEYVLRPRKRGSRYEDYEVWESDVEKPLVAALERAALKTDLDGDELVKYCYSATGQEIVSGALKVKDASEHVFGFFRSISNPMDMHDSIKVKDFIEPDQEQRQLNLKARLAEYMPGNIYKCEARWLADGLSQTHIGTLPPTLEDCLVLNELRIAPRNLCEAVWLRLSEVIKTETSRLEAIDPLKHEQDAHLAFGHERARLFVGREDILNRIADYIDGKENHPLAIWGEFGSGKSSLLAKAVLQTQARYGNRFSMVVRFIGATPESSNGRSLLLSLFRQITRSYGIDENASQLEYRDLSLELPKFFALASIEKPLVVFLDALDQLTESDNARNLIWLSTDLPPHVKLIVSTLPGECLAILKRRLPGTSIIQMTALEKRDGKKILQSWLDEFKRNLTEEQLDVILTQFEHGGGLPLYLKLAFEEIRSWHSFEKDWRLSPDVPGVIHDFFTRLSAENNHGSVLVSRTLGYLVAARNGLSEGELLDILSTNEEVIADFKRRSPHSPAHNRLPVVVWLRLFGELAAYLAVRVADGIGLLGFYHDKLREVAEANYLAGGAREWRHQDLASYFAAQPLEHAGAGGRTDLNLRKLSEQPFQQTRGAQWPELESTLASFDFLQAKTNAGLIVDLINDYQQASQRMAGMPEGLRQLRDALRLSAPVLGHKPDQLAGQLWGRLVNCELPQVQAVLNDARTSSGLPWWRPESPCFEIPGGSLESKLAGHSDQISEIVITEDGSAAVSASYDGTLKVWDLRRDGICLSTLDGHTQGVSSVALTLDGRWVISGSFDTTLKLWDLDKYACLRTMTGHLSYIQTVAVTRNGQLAVTGSADKTLRIWDLQTGMCKNILKGHKEFIPAVAVTPDGRHVISGSGDHSLRLWDLNTGDCVRILAGHKGPVVAVAIEAGGKWAVSASADGTLKLWDFRNGHCLKTLRGHINSVNAVAVSPDGRWIISGSSDKMLKIWDSHSGLCQRTFNEVASVDAIALIPGGQRAVVGCNDGSLDIWNLDSNPEKNDLSKSNASITGMALAANEHWAVASSEDGVIGKWDLYRKVCLQKMTGNAGSARSVVLTPDDSLAIVGYGNGQLQVWDMYNGQCQRILGNRPPATPVKQFLGSRNVNAMPAYHNAEVWALALTPDGRQAVSASFDMTLRQWQLDGGPSPAFPLIGHEFFRHSSRSNT